MHTDRMVGIVDRDRALQHGPKGLPDIESLRLPADEVELVWLMGRLMPDFETIAVFHKNQRRGYPSGDIALIARAMAQASPSGLRQSCKTSVGWKRADGNPRPLYQMQPLLKERNNGDTDFGS